MEFYNLHITELPLIGKKRAYLYDKLGIDSVYSLLYHFPRAYIDFTNVSAISETVLEEYAVVRGEVKAKLPPNRIRENMTTYNVIIIDPKGSSDRASNHAKMQITIFNNKYAFDSLDIGGQYYFYGKVTGNLVKKFMASPQIEPTDMACGLIPQYNLTAGLSNNMIRSNMTSALKALDEYTVETLNKKILTDNNLCSLSYALHNIHFPADNEALEIARKRLGFEEMFGFQLALLQLSSQTEIRTDYILQNYALTPFIESLPFELTKSQQDAINDCLADCKREFSMMRLLQGDVGSGKTMIAAALSYVFAKQGWQTAVMAPTEILATQHFDTFSKTLSPLGINVGLLTGSLTAKQKKEVYEQLKTGEITVIVGTHALLYADDCFSDLALIITDEQHRFGVQQRAKIIEKGQKPHVLVMSATPIPRTMALFIYGNLDISTINEMPKNRQPIETYAVTKAYRTRIYKFILKHTSVGNQVYIVCPLIEKGEKTPDELTDVTNYVESLKSGILSEIKIDILHSRMPAAKKDAIMRSFSQGEIDVLVSTTVVEVGVDVPNATLMIIENAERFGLSQLHQLRGRVGRGKDKSYCILISEKEDSARLKIMTESCDGFKIAQEDLKLRGSGDFFGNRQHGLPHFRLVSLYDDIELIKTTRQAAEKVLQDDANLCKEENQPLKRLVQNIVNEDNTSTFN